LQQHLRSEEDRRRHAESLLQKLAQAAGMEGAAMNKELMQAREDLMAAEVEAEAQRRARAAEVEASEQELADTLGKLELFRDRLHHAQQQLGLVQEEVETEAEASMREQYSI
jgi:hypothetical protein